VGDIAIPIPPLDVQRQFVAEVDGYQKVIDGARAVIESYVPFIGIDPDWDVVPLADLASVTSGGTPSKANDEFWSGSIPWISAKDMKSERIVDAELHVTPQAVAESSTKIAPAGSLLVLVRGMGLANGVPICEVMRDCAFNQDIRAIQPNKSKVKARYLAQILRQKQSDFRRVMETAAHGTLKINAEDLRSIQVPLPDLDKQQELIDVIQCENDLVDKNRELIVRFEAKIVNAVRRLWGSDLNAGIEG
jgi:restriction endonuclease S subunit